MQLIRALHDISSNFSLSFEERLQRLLSLGNEALGLKIGIVSRIEKESYEVFLAVTPDNSIARGTTFELGESYCYHTLHANGLLAFEHVKESEIATHPCYLSFGLEAYIGVPLIVNGERFGTLNFSSPEPKQGGFSETDKEYVLLLAEWVGSEIGKNTAIESILTHQIALNRQQEMFEHAAELAGVGTWEYDMSTKVCTWSRGLFRILDIDGEENVSNTTILEYVQTDNDKQKLANALEETELTGVPWTLEAQMRTPNGRLLWVVFRVNRICDDKGGSHILGAAQDVTHRVMINKELKRKRSEAERALHARSQFLANMSHEIRTPMNGLIGMLEALKNTPLDEHQAQCGDLALTSAGHLMRILNDVLDFAKIDAGHLQIESAPVNLNHVLAQQYELFQQLARKKNLGFNFNLAATHNIVVNSDETRLGQIVANLVSNAIKFTHEGKVNLTTKALRQADNQLLINIIVEDTGVGIEPSRQSRIFSPFQQADFDTTRQFGGTGLGLSIVAQLAQLMNGGVKVHSTPGEGSKFVVALQMCTVVNQQGTEQNNQAQVAQTTIKSNFSGKRVLVVEDNEINQVVIKQQLSGLGIEPDIAHNGSEAVSMTLMGITENQPYDLIVMDCQMPVMDGYEATRCIRELGEVAQTIPIVALTANALKGERDKCILAGMNDYLTKPIESERLKQCITRFLLA